MSYFVLPSLFFYLSVSFSILITWMGKRELFFLLLITHSSVVSI